ncbi:MAG: hypothetical protein AAAC48_02150, partial [Phyllobacterium sp.]|uniref:hypothetical protein n=1 Tax=Phyllobacterium sp. TaxID=1871046 RepID=UPI0030F0817E
MGQVAGDRVHRLRGARVRHQVPRGEAGQLGAGAPDQGQRQVQMAKRRAGGDHRVGLHDNSRLVQPHPRIALPE